jgi:hypothetical protein
MFAEFHLAAFRPLTLRVPQSMVRREPARARLDFRALPDHLKRDLGFLDGQGAPPRDPLRD